MEIELISLGATHYNWRLDVEKLVHSYLRKYPNITANTYKDHPFPGWDERSVDFWGPGGRGDPIGKQVGRRVFADLVGGDPGMSLRHSIYLHRWWTEWAGWLSWNANDHSGKLRHVHATFY